jgi:beta-xylosidase
MKRILFFVLCAAALCGSPSAYSQAASGNSQTYNSAVIASDIPLADPYILLHNNVYYGYGTSSDAGFEVYYSDDLTNWRKHPEMLLSKEDSYGERWFWAPEVYYNAASDTFYLFYSAEEHICVATANSPLGPFTQKVKKPMREEKSIDSSLFIDDNGTPYIFFVRFTDGNVIWAARLTDDLMSIEEETLTKCFAADEAWEHVEGRVVEGPSVIKVGGVYYMLYSANGYTSKEYGVGCATASSPLGPWTKSKRNPILQKPATDLVGTGHGAPFRDKDGKWRYVFHAHNTPQVVHPRKLYITDMKIGAKGITIDKKHIIRPVQIK